MAKVDLEKRKRVMKRSMALGHCICDPKRGCPCDIFKTKNICPCAGERQETAAVSGIKLTKHVHNAGCASKIPAGDLEDLLAKLPKVIDPAVLSGLSAGDDAAVYRISEDVTLVQTVDVFTPCVDDPFAFGKICACNCLSDIYAMGGVPRTALSILAFPSETMDKDVMFQMLSGAMEVLSVAGCSLLGGHSIKDEEIKLGFSITGTIDAKKVVSLETAKPGDILVLTKPLGVGVITFANQIGRADEKGLAEAESSMMTLNKYAAEALIETGVSACTDITGFGLFGHLARMMRHSKTSAKIFADKLPSFTGVLELLRGGVIPGAVERNSEFVGNDLIMAEGISEEYRLLGFGSETSGGLLISVPEKKHKKLLAELSKRNVACTTIGMITGGKAGIIQLEKEGSKGGIMKADVSEVSKKEEGCCCGGGDCGGETKGPAMESTVPATEKIFNDLICSMSASGKVDARTKQLIVFTLVVSQKCEDCLNMHYEKSLKMGITKEELDEAAWCAITLGGAPVRMFYYTYLKKRAGK